MSSTYPNVFHQPYHQSPHLTRPFGYRGHQRSHFVEKEPHNLPVSACQREPAGKGAVWLRVEHIIKRHFLMLMCKFRKCMFVYTYGIYCIDIMCIYIFVNGLWKITWMLMWIYKQLLSTSLCSSRSSMNNFSSASFNQQIMRWHKHCAGTNSHQSKGRLAKPCFWERVPGVCQIYL